MKLLGSFKNTDWQTAIVSGLTKSLEVISAIQDVLKQSETNTIQVDHAICPGPGVIRQEHVSYKMLRNDALENIDDYLAKRFPKTSEKINRILPQIVGKYANSSVCGATCNVYTWMDKVRPSIPPTELKRHEEFMESFFKFQKTIRSIDNLDPYTTSQILNAFLSSQREYLCSMIPNYLGQTEEELSHAVEADALQSSVQYRHLLEMVYKQAGIPINLMSVSPNQNSTGYETIKEFDLPDNMMKLPATKNFSEFFMGYKLDVKELRGILEYLVKNSYISNDSQDTLTYRLTGRLRPGGVLRKIEWTCQKNQGSPKELYYLLKCIEDNDVYTKVKKFFSGVEWPEEKNEKYMARQASISFRRYLHNEINGEVFTLNSGESD